MLNASKLCASAEACLGWPYVSPGTNDARGIDCSGLFVKAFRDQGGTIYHGSNTIYRKYCSRKGELTSISQLKPGMAVFKWNPNTPAKFNDGQGDFQHIGMVTAVNPLRIVHASSAAGCVTVDSKLGKWRFWGWLKDVAEDGSPADDGKEGDDEPVKTDTIAIVTAPTGSTVNLRTKASASSALIERVPIGSRVTVLNDQGTWTKVKYGTRAGYMMTVYLSPEAEEEEDLEPAGTIEERLTRLEKRVAALEDELTVG